MRFSILTLLGLVALAAIATAALLNANDICGRVSYSVTFVVLLVAVVAAIVLRGRLRAFWIGFAVFGVAYFSDVYADKSELLTTAISDYVFKRIDPTPSAPRNAIIGGPNSVGAFLSRRPANADFVTVFNSILSLAFAFVGGLIARYFYWLRQKQEAKAGEPPV